MKTNRIALMTFGIVLLVTAFSPAQSQPAFTFKVPLSCENLHPDVDRVWVVVRLFHDLVGIDQSWNAIYQQPPPQSTSSPDDKSVAFGGATINVGAGRRSFSRTVTVNINPAEPGKIKYYTVHLFLHNKKTNVWWYPANWSAPKGIRHTGSYQLRDWTP